MVVIKNSPASCEEVRQIARIASTCSSLEEVCEKVRQETGKTRSYHSIRSLLQGHKSCCGSRTIGQYVRDQGPRTGPVEAALGEGLHVVIPTPGEAGHGPRREPVAEEREPPTVRSVRHPAHHPEADPGQAPDRTWIDWRPEPVTYDPPHIIGRFVVFPDNHVPYHSRRSVNIAIRAAKHHLGQAGHGEATAIVIGGDFIDCQPVSRHFKDPSRSRHVQDEIDVANEVLDMYDEIGADAKYFQEGNHELRLPKYVAEKAPALVGLKGTTVPEMLHLKERGWSWIPYNSDVWLGQLMVTHDVGRCGKYAVHQSMDDIQENVVINHVHRMGMTVSPTAFGKLRVAGTFGCLLDFDQVDWQQRRKVRRTMVHGIGLGYIDSRHTPWIVPVPIVDERYCIVDGRVIF